MTIEAISAEVMGKRRLNRKEYYAVFSELRRRRHDPPPPFIHEYVDDRMNYRIHKRVDSDGELCWDINRPRPPYINAWWHLYMLPALKGNKNRSKSSRRYNVELARSYRTGSYLEPKKKRR